MKRYININRLKNILINNTDSNYGSNIGEADQDFMIYFKNGKSYKVKSGYILNWERKKKLEITERSISNKKHVKNKIKNSSGFFSTVFNAVGGVYEMVEDNLNSDIVEIKWKKIEDIEEL